MARPLRLHIPGRAYHVHTRGDNKGLIFHEGADYAKLLVFLERALLRFDAECVAYCLLDNHFHVVIVPHLHSISRIMQYVNGSYAQWFNRKYGRVGHVFQGRFKSKIIDDAEYLLVALRYVTLNAVEAGLVKRPENWRWGSYRATVGLEPAPRFLTLDRVWSAVNCDDATAGRARYLTYINGGEPAKYLHYALFFGGERLARQIAPRLVPYRPVIAHSYAERYAVRPAIDSVFLNTDSAAAVKVASAQAFHRHAYTLSEIGDLVGRNPSTISKWITHLVRQGWSADRASPPTTGPPTVPASG